MRDSEVEKVMAGLEKPVIAYGENRRDVDAIDVDNRLGAELATTHVYDVGFRHIIFFGINLIEEEFMRSRLTGYSEVMKRNGLMEESYFMKNSSRVAEKTALDILDKATEPVAIICASDRMAVGVVRAANSLNMKFGETIAVTGFDGVFLDRISSPKITTVRSPVIEMGETSAQMLLKKINENGAKQGSTLFPPKLIVRGSTVAGKE